RGYQTRSFGFVTNDTCVGIVANPASGRDIRRLVAGASVVGNADKAGIVLRVLAGLGAAGVPRALMMPAFDGLGAALERQLLAHATAEQRRGAAPLPALEALPMPLTGTAADSVRAVQLMRAAGASAIVVLGGDGTHRVVAKACGDVPLCALSTGTNNAFPEVREGTVAGLAAGLVATGRAGDGALRREVGLAVELGDADPELALVDVVLSAERFVGARALWRTSGISDLFVACANPSAVGFSSIAGLLHPLPRAGGQGLHVRLTDDLARAQLVLRVPLAPGLLAPVGVAGFRTLELGEETAVAAGPGCLALDGEREIERRPGERVTVRLVPGPLTIDVDAVMRHAARVKATRLEPPPE
ncbi:MAG TPA: NAD(+)/NADH kinase, partial [Thermoleophilaceae bacterium]